MQQSVSAPHSSPSFAISIWLFICCAMIFIMALIGAATRLTESGLSITTWAPVLGAIPPLNETDWTQAFNAYQVIPQYQILHRGMSLDAFKGIYYWEWFHRLWGRLIGFVFLIPLLVFWIQKKITRSLGVKFIALFVLGGFQGFIGWFMVQSGLEVRTSVSPYRLALHLGFALSLYAIILWMALESRGKTQEVIRPIPSSIVRHGWLALGLLAVTMVWGAFVAGLHAGEVYNTWPLMEGEIVPSTATALQPQWHNIFENPALVQCIHRWLGPTTLFVLWGWIGRCWGAAGRRQKLTLLALGLMALTQVALGIATIMTHAQIVVAVIHQAGAITLLSLLLFNLQCFSAASASHK